MSRLGLGVLDVVQGQVELVVVSFRLAAILRTAIRQHADDAKAFVDYVLSPEGQAMVADAWLMPARSDVQAKRPLLDELKILPTTSDGSSERSAVLSRFNGLFGQ